MGWYILFGSIPILCFFLLMLKKKYVFVWNRRQIIVGSDSYMLYIAVVLVILCFFSTFRSQGIGADYHNYVYYVIHGFGWYDQSEIAFNKLLEVSTLLFGENYWGFSLLVNLVIFGGVYISVRKTAHSKYVFMAMLVFTLNPYMYVQSTFNVIRQGIMVALVSFGYADLVRGRDVKFAIWILVGSLFHKTAIFFMALYLFQVVCWDKKKFGFIATVAFVINLLDHKLGLTNLFIRAVGYERYIAKQANTSSSFDFPLYALFIYGVLILLLNYYDKLYENKLEKSMVDVYFFSLCFLLIAIKGDMLYRLYIAFVYISLPAIEIVFRNLRKYSAKVCTWVSLGYGVYYVFLYVMFLYSVHNNPQYVPFKFFWQ